VKKKRDKIDGLFRDYFAGGSSKIRKSSMPMVGSMMCELSSKCLECFDDPYGAVKEKCPDAAKLGAYIDGSFDRREADVLEGHIQGCKKCREKVREAKSAVEQFEKDALPEAPQTVSSEDLSRLSKKKPKK
jgi:hypothetical protein